MISRLENLESITKLKIPLTPAKISGENADIIRYSMFPIHLVSLSNCLVVRNF